jgi:hypothetical protein
MAGLRFTPSDRKTLLVHTLFQIACAIVLHCALCVSHSLEHHVPELDVPLSLQSSFSVLQWVDSQQQN